MTIVEFLNAQLDEDQTEAEAAPREDGNATHMSCVDPDRVLADIAAKRAIIALHKPAEHPLNGKFDNLTGRSTELGLVCEECSGVDDPYIDQRPYPCGTIRILASVHADCPDYQQEWAPD